MNYKLQNAITDYINSKNKTNNNTAVRGVISDNYKVLVNGVLYNYVSAVDVQFSVGEYVFVIVSNNTAVIVGK